MDRTEPRDQTGPPPAPLETPHLSPAAPEGKPGGSQSRVPAVFFWVVAAALLFRIATAFFNRGQAASTAGLVHWHPHESVAAAAVKARKPVLYDFTAAWCGPCHVLDTEGWSDSRIAEIVNEDFLPARVVDREREDGSNPRSIADLRRTYSVDAFPTLIIADASGREIARMEGYGGKQRLITFLEEGKKKADGK